MPLHINQPTVDVAKAERQSFHLHARDVYVVALGHVLRVQNVAPRLIDGDPPDYAGLAVGALRLVRQPEVRAVNIDILERYKAYHVI